jgi:hypothetical protein
MAIWLMQAVAGVMVWLFVFNVCRWHGQIAEGWR